MSFASTMRTLSNINCAAASVTSYITDKQSGKSTAESCTNLFANIGNGFARNEAAYTMQKYGNSTGNFLNSVYGYGNAEANTAGTIGLMNAWDSWMFFNAMPRTISYTNINYGYPMMPITPMVPGTQVFGMGFGCGGFYC